MGSRVYPKKELFWLFHTPRQLMVESEAKICMTAVASTEDNEMTSYCGRHPV